MNLTIRELDNSDALVLIYNRSYDDQRSTVEGWRHTFATIPHAGQWQRWMAEADGRAGGWTSHRRDLNNARSGSFRLHLMVDPNARSRGVGRQLYNHCLVQLQQGHDNMPRLFFSTRENLASAIRFWKPNASCVSCGKSCLRLTWIPFDHTPFLPKARQTQADGIEVQPLSELQKRFPDWKERVYLQENKLKMTGPLPEGLSAKVRRDPNDWLHDPIPA